MPHLAPESSRSYPAVASLACVAVSACLLLACALLSGWYARLDAYQRTWVAFGYVMLLLWGLLAAFAVSGAGAFLGFRSRRSTAGAAGLAGNVLALLGTAALAALVAAS
jgi:hypothetical protein